MRTRDANSSGPRRAARAFVLAIAALATADCSPTRSRPDAVIEELVEDFSVGPVDAIATVDGGSDIVVPEVAPLDPCNAGPCGPREVCGVLADGGVGSGNGLDDDCNGRVDDGCVCMQDQREECFPGPPDRKNVGVCRAGSTLCTELQMWGSCVGAVLPSDEVCDGLDNDCDGVTDEGLDGCATQVRCPAFLAARPLQDFTADARVYDPALQSVRWSVACPDSVRTCPMVMNPTGTQLTYRPLQSGRYTVTADITRADGSAARCRYPLYVVGGGLRVELDWDTKGGERGTPGVDLDLHLLPIDRRRTSPLTWFSANDCFYRTCVAPGGLVNWGVDAADMRFTPSRDATDCQGAPPPYGDLWRAAGRCSNPRLDTDTITCDPAVRDPSSRQFCFVENLNVDNPPDDVTFRIAVNFYRDHGTCASTVRTDDVTHAHLLVYCNGIVRAELGDVDNGIVSFPCAQNASLGSSNWTWLAADVRFGTNACGLGDCRVIPLRVSEAPYVQCDRATDDDEICVRDRRVFVRRAGNRPVDSVLGESL